MSSEGMVAIVPGPSAFDYSTLTPEAADLAQRVAHLIRTRHRGVVRFIINTGIDLLAIKELLDHGQFGAWLEAEFGWSERSAQRYMAAGAAFRDKTDIVADLAPTTVHLLAAPSTPETVREEIVRRREGGERLPDHTVKMMITEAVRAKGKSGHRRAARQYREKQRSPSALRRAEKHRQTEEALRQQRARALSKAADIIRERVGDALPELLVLLHESGGAWSLHRELTTIPSSEPVGTSGIPSIIRDGGHP